jgi:hypothetical protein
MEQDPSEADSRSGNYILCLLWSPKVQKGAPLDPILSQMNPVHILSHICTQLSLDYPGAD